MATKTTSKTTSKTPAKSTTRSAGKTQSKTQSKTPSRSVNSAKEALNKFKMECASEVGVTLKQGYNGNLTAKQSGAIGGQMVKKMIKSVENSMK